MAERIRVLFVDDEQHVLDGLLRAFRPLRQSWDIATATSGQSALTQLANQPADVVVSDMRMPGMDGAELLTRVQAILPRSVRIILSGQSERERALRRVGPCHHYLAKPCEPQRLRVMIERAWDLRGFLRSPALETWRPDGEALPTLPQIYLGLMAELQNQDPSLVRLAALIEQDIGTAANLLHTVNSAAFGLKRTVSGIADAVALAGIECLRALVLALHVFTVCGRQQGSGLDLVALWQHSVATGHLARAIVQTEHGPAPVAEAAFTAGLLHDCGQMLLAARDPAAYAEALTGCVAGAGLSAAETQRFGVAHEQAGAWLLLGWDLPDDVVEAVAWHHQPERAAPDGRLDALAAVHLADALLQNVPPLPQQPDPNLLARLGLASRLDAWSQFIARTGA